MKRRYFVTGATGTVGSALVPFLLKDTEAEIWLLLRARDTGEFAQRLESLCAFWVSMHTP